MEKIKLTGEMKEIEIKKCPICKKAIKGFPAISRKDNKTEICSECGQYEALVEFFKQV